MVTKSNEDFDLIIKGMAVFGGQRAPAEPVRNKTEIVIAHRLATVCNTDQILVMGQGRIIQRGKHAELLWEDGLYRRFVGIRKNAETWV